jgi:phosphatidylinositol alpha-1,6-mannosyltransferase
MRIWMPVRVAPAHGVGGGMERVSWSLAHGLARRGHKVTVVTTAHPAGMLEERDSEVRVVYVRGSTWRRYETSWWEDSYTMLGDEHTAGATYDVILSQSAGGLGYLSRARNELDVASVVLFHGSAIGELRTAWRGARSLRGFYRLGRLGWRLPPQIRRWRKVAPAVTRWAAISHEVAEDNRRVLGIPRAVEVVPPAVDVTRFRPDAATRASARRDLGMPPSAPLLVIVARLEREKGVDVALRAARMVRADHPEARVVVAGTGHDERRLRRLVQDMDMGGACTFLGLVAHDGIPAVLASGAVFVHSSLCAEGRPVSLVEAAAAGLPVVASDSPGAREVVVHGTTGVLVRRADVRGMAGAICGLLADDGRRSAMGAAAREAARGWGCDAMVDTVDRLLGEAARSRAR